MAARRNTRERILETSLALFNQLGEPNVSTNHIADELDISPGNLYYHFRNKEDIVVALYKRLEDAVDEQLLVPRPEETPTLENVWFYLHLLFETIGTYRFFYRDLVNIIGRYSAVERRFRRLLRREKESLHAVCVALERGGVMRATPSEIAALSNTLLLLMTYWFNFALLTARERDSSEAVYQAFSVLAPHLDAHNRRHLLQLAERYR